MLDTKKWMIEFYFNHPLSFNLLDCPLSKV